MNGIVQLSLGVVILAATASYVLPDLLKEGAPQQALTESEETSSWTGDFRPQNTNTDFLPKRAVRINAGRRGHFHLDARVNGREIPFVVDTGASSVALSYESARRVGFNPKPSDFIGRSQTANGIARFAPVTISEIRFKSITVRNVRAAVLEKGALGDKNLLGNTFLSRLSEFNVRDGTLVMIP
ncbi:MAG: TIGR02281 family clan AA aspartic protease [Pseudomonadota bacterium]